MTQLEFIVTAEYSGERVDKALPLMHSDFSRNGVQQLINEGLVLVNSGVFARSPPFQPDAEGEQIRKA